MSELEFHPIPDIIKEVAAGRLVIVADDPKRENEADLVGAAAKVSPEMITFMANHGRGLICAPINQKRAKELELPPMSRENREGFKTNFTNSVDAAEGITTGISGADRARTVSLMADASATAKSLVQPGHIFPLVGMEGGVLRRAGHTEASLDLAALAGLPEAGVICEIIHENGEMARVGDLGSFQQKHGLKACTISQLIAYRRSTEQLIEREEVIKLPTDYGEFDCYLYRVLTDKSHHIALVKGEILPEKETLVRVHSECLTGDVFGSSRCDCGSQLHRAMEQIAEEGGVLLYLRQEGRGIGLGAKIRAYKLQEDGFDTVEANQKLGFAPDLRDYGMGAQMLRDIGVRKMRLLTNNPRKVVGLDGYNLEIVEKVPIPPTSNPHNANYLQTKKEKLGHDF